MNASESEGLDFWILFEFAAVMHRYHPDHVVLVDVGHEVVGCHLAELVLLEPLLRGRFELGVFLAA